MSVAGTRIELWVEERAGRAAVNPVLAALLAELERDGARTVVRVPERELHEPGRPTFDLALLKSATSLALARALGLEHGGGRFLNSAAATVRAHDKAAAIAALAAAGIPVPLTLLAGPAAHADHEHATGGRWIAKPVRGVHGRGVVVAPSFGAAVALANEPSPSPIVDDGTRLLQPYVGTGPDVKAYVAGETIVAASKQFTRTSFASDSIEPVELDRRSREIVHACGEALGLRLYGVDLRVDLDGAATVVDVNPFPGYRGFPSVAHALRRELETALEQR